MSLFSSRRILIWEGQPLHNKSLLITAEEGIGDEIFFASCFNDAIGAAEQCLIECDPRLVSLFQRSFPDAAVREVERTGSRLKPVQSYYWLCLLYTSDAADEGLGVELPTKA